MDPLLLTLLTISANTLITYFLLNRQEKRLASHAFQEQIKFQRSHEKMVETLENLYQKYALYSDEVEQILYEGYRTEFKLNQSDFNESSNLLEEYRVYFVNNRLFLSQDVSAEIEYIYSYSNLFRELMRALLIKSREDMSPTIEKLSRKSLKMLEIEYDIDNPNNESLITDLRAKSRELNQRLEELYQLVYDKRKETRFERIRAG